MNQTIHFRSRYIATSWNEWNSKIAHSNMNYSILPTLSYSSAQERNHMSSSLLICINMNFSQLCHMPTLHCQWPLFLMSPKMDRSCWKWVSWSLCKSLSVWTQCELVYSSVLFLGRTHTHTHTLRLQLASSSLWAHGLISHRLGS